MSYRWMEMTASGTVYLGEKIFLKSTSPFTITLQANPDTNGMISFIDGAGLCATNNITLDRNGEKIMGLEENFVIDEDEAAFDLVYRGTNKGWVIR